MAERRPPAPGAPAPAPAPGEPGRAPARLRAWLDRTLTPLAARRGLALPTLAAGVALVVVAAGLLAAGSGQRSESVEIDLQDAQADLGLAALDGDGDRLSDLEELTAGTDARSADTDGDGLDDQWEVRHAALDPRSNTHCPDPLAADGGADCDLDGLPNAEERAAGTDPNVADVDLDGLPDGFEVRGGSDPFVPDADRDEDRDGLTTLDEMRNGTRADREDSDLDGLTDPEELTSTRTDPARTSTGGSGAGDGWLHAWGLPLDDAGVGFEDPDLDDLTNLEEYQFGARLALREAQRANRTIQGGELRTLFLRALDPFGNDTDGDRMGDGFEVRYGLDPLDDGRLDPRLGPAADPDLDGLPNRDEAAAGSNPFLPDSDGDGLTDREEVAVGWVVRVGEEVRNVTSDPSRADSDGDGLNDLEERQGLALRPGGDLRFPPLDPRSPDSDVDGLGDLEEVTLPIVAPTDPRRLDPTNPDTDGDGLADGGEHRYWTQRQAAQGGGAEEVLDRLAAQLGTAGGRGNREGALAALAPGGDADHDGRPNLLDRDSDGDAIDDGREVEPDDKATSAESRVRRPLPATDPALVDTDGEGLPDKWEHDFATYDFALGDWNLNASLRDSLRRNDGKTDADRDLDDDGVEHNGTGYARRVAYAHANLFEYLAGTHPNVPDSDLDGLADGWELYFTCVSSPVPRGGCGTLSRLDEAERAVELDPAKADTDGDAAPDGDEVAAEVAYVRFVRAASLPLPASALDAGAGEAYDPCANQGPQDDACDLYPGTIVRVHGHHRLNFSQASSKGLDPTLRDTDGDGLHDAWEAAHDLRPLDPSDARADNDGDSLDSLAEHGLGTDPTLADTDQGELPDPDDPNPLYPPDDAPLGDTDCDGVLNRDETAGGTALADPDSDADGLLDGPTIAFYAASRKEAGGRVTQLPASEVVATEGCELTEAQLLQALTARGIAPSLGGAAGDLVALLGENDLATGPGEADTDADGLPDGWEAYWHELAGRGGAPDPLEPDASADPDGDGLRAEDEHGLGLPAGWAQRRCGPWWLGSDPRARDTDADGLPDGAIVDGTLVGADLDLDNDGLDDTTGEDPVPLFDHGNALLGLLADCAATARHAESWVFRGGRRASAGLDRTSDGVPDARDYAQTRLAGVRADVANGTLAKGQPFTVTGRVAVAEDTADANASVEGAVVLVNLVHGPAARSGLPADVLGVGTSGPDGTFTVHAALAPARTAQLGSSGMVFGAPRGAGPLSWTLDTSQIVPRDGYRLVVWTLNRSAGPAGPYGFEARDGLQVFEASGIAGASVASGAADADLPPLLTVTAGSALELPAGLNATVGAPLRLEVAARDSAGDPLPAALLDGKVRARWLGTSYRDTADDPEIAVKEGGFDLALQVPDTTLLGAHALEVTYSGVGVLVGRSEASASVAVRYPTNLTARVLSDGKPAIAGEPFAVEGTLRDFRGQGVPAGLLVQVPLGGRVFNGTTADGGAWRVEGEVPEDVAVGTQLLDATFPGSELYEPSRGDAGALTLAQRTLLRLDVARGSVGRDLVVTGTLQDLAGNPVDDPTEEANATVIVTTPVLRGPANVTGTAFRFTVPRSLLPEAGAILVRAEFAGSTLYQASTDAREIPLASATTLTLDGAPVARGVPSALGGRLADERGRGLEGEQVRVAFGNLTLEAITGPEGRFAAPLRLAADHPLGGVVTEASYRGGRGGLLEPAPNVSAVLQVLAATRLDLPARTQALGPLLVEGALRDDRGQAVPGAKLQLELGSATLGFAITDIQGRFQAEFALPSGTGPGTHALRARYAGSGTLAAVEVETPYRLLTPSEVRVLRAEPLVRGQVASVLALLQDAGGTPLGQRSLELLVEGTAIGVATTDARGQARLQGQVPGFLAGGNATLVVRFAGDDGHTASRDTEVLPLLAPTELRVQAPDHVAQGEVFRALIVMRDEAGRPLADQSLVVTLRDEAVPIALTTNSAGEAALTARIAEVGTGNLRVEFRGGAGLAPAAVTFAVQSRAPLLGGPGALAVVALLGAAILVASALLASRFRRGQVAEARAILAEAEHRLYASTEYQAAILWAYRRLVEHGRQHGFLAKESFTPREFVAALAKALPVGLHHLENLVGVFEEARYSPHPIGPGHRDRALAALRGIERDLRAVQPAPQAPLEVTHGG